MLEWNEIQSSHSGLCDRSSAERPQQEQHVRQLKQRRGGSASKGWRANQAVQTCESGSNEFIPTSYDHIKRQNLPAFPGWRR